MGKQKNPRFKLHLPAKRNEVVTLEKSTDNLPIQFKENVFEGINFSGLFDEKKLTDDTLSIKSSKSIKSDKIIPKKEKLKLRRDMLLKKIDTVNQLKKEQKIREKKRKIPIIGDTKPMLDNLPSLDALFQMKNKGKAKSNGIKKPKKAIESSKKSQKKIIQNISIYKNLLKNPALSKNPLQAVTGHLKAVVEQERKSIDKQK